ncbi:MAG: hypothetical protein ACJ8J0_16305 [Longimicrobiaceae bacterium]
MRKLLLQLDALQVESFETGSMVDRRGTVRGHDTRETEFCATPYKPCKPTYGCGGVTLNLCARHDDDEVLARAEPQLPPV